MWILLVAKLRAREHPAGCLPPRKDEQKCLLHRAVLMMVMTGIHVLGEKASRSPAPQVRIWSQLPLEPLESQEVGNWEEMKAC